MNPKFKEALKMFLELVVGGWLFGLALTFATAPFILVYYCLWYYSSH